MKNLKLAISAVLLFAVLAWIGYALTPPPPPPVNQNLGIYDTSIALFKTNGSFTNVTSNGQMACRTCHNSTGTTAPGYTNLTLGGVDSRHHWLVQYSAINPATGVAFGCQDCHPSTPGIGNGILLDHSCTDCHNSTPFWADSIGANVGNLSRPHHFNTSYDNAGIGNPASARQCNVCHGSFVSNYNDNHYIPSYATTVMITPYAKWKATNFSQPLTMLLYASDSLTVTNKEWGGCESCHLGTVNTSIVASGAYTGTPIDPNHDTHHQEILDGNVTVNGTVLSLGGRTPGATCSWCHVILPGQTAHGGVYLFNLTNTYNLVNGSPEVVVDDLEVRNSTIEAMDAANGSFEPGTTNVTINGTGCEKCHDVATLHNIQYNYVQNGPQGLGHINNNTDCSGCHDAWLPTNSWGPTPTVPSVTAVSPAAILAGAQTTLTITGYDFVNDVYTSVVSIDGATYTPSSITANQIVVSIPALTAGSHQLQIVKNGDIRSKLLVLDAVPPTTIASATMVSSRQGITLTLKGNGFGATKPTSTLSVSVFHNGNLIASTTLQKWSDTTVVAKFPAGSIASGDIATVVTAASGAAQTTIS